jgi:myo-inositol-1(or 4)-monophosphatase
MVAGLVYNPATDDMFVAEKGQGAYGNNHRLRVAARRNMAEALIGCGIPHLGKLKEHSRFKAEFGAVMAQVVNMRRLGAAALDLCYVASGRYDGFWEHGLQSWDIAAGMHIIKEAGGFVTDLDGGSDMLTTGSICAGNEFIHPRLLELIRKA